MSVLRGLLAVFGINFDNVVDATMEEYEMEAKREKEELKAAKKREKEERERQRRIKMSKSGHIPGTKHRVAGAAYVVGATGAWIRTSLRLTEQRDAVKAAHRHDVVTRHLKARTA